MAETEYLSIDRDEGSIWNWAFERGEEVMEGVKYRGEEERGKEGERDGGREREPVF